MINPFASQTTFSVGFAAYRLLSLYLFLTLISCSSQNPISSLEIQGEDLSNPVVLSLIAEKPNIYTFTISGDEAPTYLTAIKDCSLSKKVSYLTTTRQLFVGFDKLRMIKQIKTEEDMLLSTATAFLDGANLNLVVFSHKTNKCITDFVFWMNGDTTPDELNIKIPEFKTIVTRGFNENNS